MFTDDDLLYDMQGVRGASVGSDLDLRRFENEYLPSAVSREVLEKNECSPEAQLQSLRLTAQDGTPTVTAILLLGRDPSFWMPGAYIQFVRYAGNAVTDSIKDQKAIRGTLSDQLIELDKILKAHISNALDTSGERHVEKPDYPFVALRELSRNAVIHRNYEGTCSPVRVSWFADRVEIINPWSVCGAVTRENFGKGDLTAYRNPTIAEAMKAMGFAQKSGRGISTVRRALGDNMNPELKFDVHDTFVLATVRKQQ